MNALLVNYHSLVATGNRFAAAGANALFILILILLIGFAAKLVSGGITQIFAVIFGAAPAYAFCNFITYPGVVHHELAHALLAAVTGAKVKRITLKPRGNTLGSVDFIPRGGALRQSLQMTLSAIAPVVCGLVTLTIMREALFPHLTIWWQYAIGYYFFLCILLHMDLSPQDVGIAAKGMPLFLFIVFVIFIFWRADLVTLVYRVLLSFA